jgi:hypothetical protein
VSPLKSPDDVQAMTAKAAHAQDLQWRVGVQAMKSANRYHGCDLKWPDDVQAIRPAKRARGHDLKWRRAERHRPVHHRAAAAAERVIAMAATFTRRSTRTHQRPFAAVRDAGSSETKRCHDGIFTHFRCRSMRAAPKDATVASLPAFRRRMSVRAHVRDLDQRMTWDRQIVRMRTIWNDEAPSVAVPAATFGVNNIKSHQGRFRT